MWHGYKRVLQHSNRYLIIFREYYSPEPNPRKKKDHRLVWNYYTPAVS